VPYDQQQVSFSTVDPGTGAGVETVEEMEEQELDHRLKQGEGGATRPSYPRQIQHSSDGIGLVCSVAVVIHALLRHEMFHEFPGVVELEGNTSMVRCAHHDFEESDVSGALQMTEGLSTRTRSVFASSPDMTEC
jgi:hypothetical protein